MSVLIVGVVRAVLKMSLSAGILTLLLCALTPLVRNRLSKSVQYYSRLLVLTAFLLPLGSFMHLPFASPIQPLMLTVEQSLTSSTQTEELIKNENNGGEGVYKDEGVDGADVDSQGKRFAARFSVYLSAALLIAALSKFLLSSAKYCIYMKKLHGVSIKADSGEIEMLKALCEKMGVRRFPRLYRSPLALTPMLAGVISPAIYLPEGVLSPRQLEYSLRHELTHLKRKDLIVKWFAFSAECLHWFNPLIVVLRRGTDTFCELSCDEALVRNLDGNGKKDYGNTLIEMATDAKYRRIKLSTTMGEEKKKLKERLESIMESKKKSSTAVLFSVLFILGVIGGIVLFGCTQSVDKKGISPYVLTEREENLIKSLGLDRGNSIIYSFDAPEEALSMEINFYILKEGEWVLMSNPGISIGEDRLPAGELKGLFTLKCADNYSLEYTVNSSGLYSGKTEEIALTGEVTVSAKAYLGEFTPIELEREIPVALYVYDDIPQIETLTPDAFFEPSFLEGKKAVLCVTLRFTESVLD